MPLAERYPSWSLWRSTLDDGGPGSYYATRMDRDLTDAETDDGFRQTLAADHVSELDEALAVQADLDRQPRDAA